VEDIEVRDHFSELSPISCSEVSEEIQEGAVFDLMGMGRDFVSVSNSSLLLLNLVVSFPVYL
jgi:hypothetical protein